MRSCSVILFLFLFFSHFASAYVPIQYSHYSALLDYDSDTLLFENNIDEKMHPSSMSKLLTLYVAFTKLRSGMIHINHLCNIGPDAYRKEGTTMFLKQGQNVSILDLLKGIIIISANDAAVALSECMCGSQEAFVQEMNFIANSIGLSGSRFSNSHGLSQENHYMTPRDVLTIAKRIFDDFPEYYHMFSEPGFDFNGVVQKNTNKLLSANIGVDGLKTGRTQAGGYGVVASASLNGRRLFAVVNGLESDQDRWKEIRSIIFHGFNHFESKLLFKKDVVLHEVNVLNGVSKKVQIVPVDDVFISYALLDRDKIKVSMFYNEPIHAPIYKNQKLGYVRINLPGQKEREIDLYSNIDIAELSVIGKVLRNIASILKM